MGLYAAHSYIERASALRHPSELVEHACLTTQFWFDRPVPAWPLSDGGDRMAFPIRPVAMGSDPEVLHSLLLAGEGIQLTNHVRVKQDLGAGRLVPVLPLWRGPEPVLYALRPSGRIQPPKVKALLDFLVPRLDLNPIE